MAIDTTAPLSNSSVPATWVATSTGISVPFIGSLVTSRSDRGRAVEPMTLATGPEQLDQIGDVVWPHVEHRPAAAQIVEAGRRVPALVARTHEEGAAGDRHADRAVVDQLARGLVAAAEERVRRAADAQALGRRKVHHLARLGHVDAERLLRVHMLAGVEHRQADVGVGQRHGQVDHDLDVVALQQLIDPHRRNAELGAALLGGGAAHVGDRAAARDRRSAAPPSDTPC